MGDLGRRKRAVFLVMAVETGLIVVATGSQGLACGYEDPQSVSRGSLSWSYPDSLYVIGAISKEVAARRLPLANFNRGGVDLFGHNSGWRRPRWRNSAQCSVRRRRGHADIGRRRTVEPMLWARFEPTAGGMRTAVHVPGPAHGDLVIVTGEAVIAEIRGRASHSRRSVRARGGTSLRRGCRDRRVCSGPSAGRCNVGRARPGDFRCRRP